MSATRFDQFYAKYGIRLTADPIPPAPGRDPRLDRDLADIHSRLHSSPRTVIPRLRKIIAAHPEEGSAYNFLYVAYEATGDRKAAKAILEETLHRLPNYVFGAVSFAMFEEGCTEVIRRRRYLGPNLSITDWPAHADGVYHIDEFLGFEYAAINYLLCAEELSDAHARLNRLLELGISPTTPQFQDLLEGYEEVQLQQLRQRMAQAKYREIVPKFTPSVRLSSEDRNYLGTLDPLRDLLLTDPEELTAAEIDRVLALPRPEVVAELRRYLRGGLAGYQQYRRTSYPDRWNDDDETFSKLGANALSLAGVLGTPELLPAVLDYLRIDDYCIEFFTGDFPNLYLQPTLLALAEPDPTPLIDYLYEPQNSSFDRLHVATALAQLGVHHPHLRPRVLTAFQTFWEHLLAADPDAPSPLLDTLLVSGMVAAAAPLRAPELLPLLQQLWARHWVDEQMTDSLASVADKLRQPATPRDRDPLPTSALEYFTGAFGNRLPTALPSSLAGKTPLDLLLKTRHLARLTQAFPTDLPNFGETIDLHELQSAPTVPLRSGPKVGRNDPCPCGSGRKYKRCCLGR